MTDSPMHKVPIDPLEEPILEKLLNIRDRLLVLKSDKTKYVKSHDVLPLYEEVIAQVHDLNQIRETKRDEQNRLDKVLDDCLQLISLFFMTVGRNSELPAAYSLTSTISRLLEHLKEAGFFCRKDLSHIKQTLVKIQQSIDQGKADHSAHLVLLIETRIENCKITLEELEQSLGGLSPELEPTYDKLVSILRSLSGANLKRPFPKDEILGFQKQLRDMEAHLEGQPQALAPSDQSAEEQYVTRLRHISYDKNAVMPGQEKVVELLGRCLLWVEISMHRQGSVDGRFRDVFEELYKIHRALEKLALTQAWSLRETDLYGYQRKLDRIDEARVDGQFLDEQGQASEIFEQRAMLYLLRKSYATIYFMITSSEPVSEALLPIYNQLLTLRRCLVEVKRSGGVSSPRELYPYSMKLNSIDNMREDGKFIVNGDIPEGQGSVAALLSECFELAYELRTDADRDDDEKESAGVAVSNGIGVKG